MAFLSLDLSLAEGFVGREQLNQLAEKAVALHRNLLEDNAEQPVKGWVDPAAQRRFLGAVAAKAREVRENADVFVLVGVGGSNQAARAVIQGLGLGDGPRILYAGNTLSANYLANLLRQLEGKSVYINVIAKNFETLEPGSHFRVLRSYLQGRYSKEELARRIILTGTHGSRLEQIAAENGYTFLTFPDDIGGRFSAFSPVGLFPMAVAGADIQRLLEGGEAMAEAIKSDSGHTAVQYAVLRNALHQKGFLVEQLVAFEPQLAYFFKWWVQLFGESEGKEQKGIYPAAACYSEDLHSMGQYLQDGARILIETFLKVKQVQGSVVIAPDKAFDDRFDYLDGMDFTEINKAAESATLEAHHKGGVPCIGIELEALDEYAFGQLFYFFMFSCALSGKLLGVNPFDQEGVEEYKRSMFEKLGK